MSVAVCLPLLRVSRTRVLLSKTEIFTNRADDNSDDNDDVDDDDDDDDDHNNI
jgi:hypothetical protein